VRILLDEGVPDIIQKRFLNRSIVTVQELGWRGLKNGALLERMAGRFDVIITTDKNLPFQQNLIKRQIAAIVLPSNRIRVLKPLLPEIETILSVIRPGEAVELEPR
jgi:hypothetical protein